MLKIVSVFGVCGSFFAAQLSCSRPAGSSTFPGNCVCIKHILSEGMAMVGHTTCAM